MRFVSTRQGGADGGLSFSDAIRRGIAPDGGLYVPEAVPRLERSALSAIDTPASAADVLLAPMVEGDALAPALASVCVEALDFEIPVTPLGGKGEPAVLELFHGPTSAFKDVGARFLATCLGRLRRNDDAVATILVATSGDTGAAVAAAFHRREGFRVVVLYPEGLVSPRQAHQLSCWGDNVATFRVAGNFDDCQRLVKAAFADPRLSGRLGLNSANSINLGRLLPQTSYYAMAAQAWASRTGEVPGFIIPTGNLGNAFACVLAREMGLPIGDIVLATNANRPVPDFLATGEWAPRPSVPTLASAMDVGNPSNMERLRWLFPDLETLRGKISAIPVSDDEIRAAIAGGVERWGRVFCPHTATAVRAWESMPPRMRERPWIVVATAHAAKFDTVVEPLIGSEVPVPVPLARLLERPAHARPLSPDLDEFRGALTQFD
jgi:threonine synthase